MEVPQLLLAFFHRTHLHKEPVNVFLWFCWKGKRNNLDLLHVWTWTTFPSLFWMRVSQPLPPQQTTFGFSGAFCNNWQHTALSDLKRAIGTHPPSQSIFSISCNFQEYMVCNRLALPPVRLPPLFGKFWTHYSVGLLPRRGMGQKTGSAPAFDSPISLFYYIIRERLKSETFTMFWWSLFCFGCVVDPMSNVYVILLISP